MTLVRTSVTPLVECNGWALNLSRGGLRAVVEERLELDEALLVRIPDIAVEQTAKVVWAQDESDGGVVGVAFDEPLSGPAAAHASVAGLDAVPGPSSVSLLTVPAADDHTADGGDSKRDK